jgi:hypothetical protein
MHHEDYLDQLKNETVKLKTSADFREEETRMPSIFKVSPLARLKYNYSSDVGDVAYYRAANFYLVDYPHACKVIVAMILNLLKGKSLNKLDDMPRTDHLHEGAGDGEEGEEGQEGEDDDRQESKRARVNNDEKENDDEENDENEPLTSKQKEAKKDNRVIVCFCWICCCSLFFFDLF